MPFALDLSHTVKLKGVEFHLERPTVQWIVTTLQTARTRHLQQITIVSVATFNLIEEMDRQEWQDLDHLLVRLWTSHSIITKMKCARARGRMVLREAVRILLPQLVSKGVECEVVDSWELGEL